jgi:hypothetical protein
VAGEWVAWRSCCDTARVPRASVVALAVAAAVALGPVGTAFADPPVPGDYRASVVSVEPAVDGVDVRILGGDAFVEIEVVAGVAVEVPGYQGEPYLRILPDGTVEENRRSPTRWVSQDRYAASPVPPDATVDAEPQWRVVGSDGRWAWHDHRAHWMGDRPPPGLSPGDQVLDGVVPLVVDGVPVDVRVIAVWVPGPDAAPTWAGAAVGFAASALVVVRSGRRPRRTGRDGRRNGRRSAVATLAVAVLAGVMAAVVGLWQFRSFPPEAGSPVRGWLLPVTAVLAAVIASAVVTVRPRSGAADLAVVAGALTAGVQLGQWWWWRRAVWSEPVLPTDAPPWLDRSVTAGVAVVSVTLVVVAAAVLLRWLTAPARQATSPAG